MLTRTGQSARSPAKSEYAGVAELADARDLKSRDGNIVPVQKVLDFQGVSDFEFPRFTSGPPFWASDFQDPFLDDKNYIHTCRCGGIGRRLGFKIQCWKQRTGSSPVTGTISSVHKVFDLVDTRFVLCMSRRSLLVFYAGILSVRYSTATPLRVSAL